MKTIQCTHPPHHHNGFVATCRLWMASGGVHALLLTHTFSLLALTTDSILKSTHSRDFQHKTQNNQWDVCTVEQKATIFLAP